MTTKPTGNPPGRPREHFKTNAEAARATIRQMDAKGALREVDALLVTNLLTLAAAVDENPGRAVLRNEYRMAANEVRRLGEDDASGFLHVLDGMRAEVGNAETAGKADAGRRGGLGGPAVGVGPDAVATNGARRRAGAR